jgi:hypothetical protein
MMIFGLVKNVEKLKKTKSKKEETPRRESK